MAATNFHMGVDVRGALKTWTSREARACKKDDGSRMTLSEVRDALMLHLVQGHEVIPMGKCDNWDWKEGCQGHPEPTETR